jgi:hypothetical protein
MLKIVDSDVALDRPILTGLTVVSDISYNSLSYGRGAQDRGCLKRVQGFVPAEGLGVSPNSASPQDWGSGAGG